MSKKYKAPRIIIAATGSGKGKTTVTTSLLMMLKDKGFDVHAFKCGPDYIDPMYHSEILKVPSGNLDPFFLDEDLQKSVFLDNCGEINIIEGCMGLYDGIGFSSECSPYSLATSLHTPIILIVDALKKGYSILAEIKGFLQMDRYNLIKGIFLNRISDSFYERIKSEIEKEINIPVVGYLPGYKGEIFESRHLGLKSTEENKTLDKISAITKDLQHRIDIDRIIEIAKAAKDFECSKNLNDYIGEMLKGEVIGVAFDDAFNFYYRENLKALSLAGAKLVYFSPLTDSSVPNEATSLYLGGGYPELYLKKLSNNKSMKESILDFVQSGRKVFAECGGFLYLIDSVDGQEMTGIFNDEAHMTKGLVRFGYVEAQYNGISVKGHEFHHYDVGDPGKEFEVTKVSNGLKYMAERRYKNCIAGFLHLSFLSNPEIMEVLFSNK